MFSGINAEGVDTAKKDVSHESNPCKQLDYEDYANYLIVMSGDLLGKDYSSWLFSESLQDSEPVDLLPIIIKEILAEKRVSLFHTTFS